MKASHAEFRLQIDELLIGWLLPWLCQSALEYQSLAHLQVRSSKAEDVPMNVRHTSGVPETQTKNGLSMPMSVEPCFKAMLRSGFEFVSSFLAGDLASALAASVTALEH